MRDTETLDDDGRPTFEPLDPPPYIAVGRRCLSCAAKENLRRELEKAYKDMPSEAAGVQVVLERNPVLDNPVPDVIPEGVERQ